MWEGDSERGRERERNIYKQSNKHKKKRNDNELLKHGGKILARKHAGGEREKGTWYLK